MIASRDNPQKFLRSFERGEVALGGDPIAEQVRRAYRTLAEEAKLPPEHADRLVELFRRTRRT